MELTMSREIKENGQVLSWIVVMARIGEAGGRIPEFVEEGVAHGLDGRQALRGSVLQKCRNQVDSLRGSFPEYLGLNNQHPTRWAIGSDSYLIEGMRLDLREFVLHVIGVHGPDLLAGGSAKNLDDFH